MIPDETNVFETTLRQVREEKARESVAQEAKLVADLNRVLRLLGVEAAVTENEYELPGTDGMTLVLDAVEWGETNHEVTFSFGGNGGSTLPMTLLLSESEPEVTAQQFKRLVEFVVDQFDFNARMKPFAVEIVTLIDRLAGENTIYDQSIAQNDKRLALMLDDEFHIIHMSTFTVSLSAFRLTVLRRY